MTLPVCCYLQIPFGIQFLHSILLCNINSFYKLLIYSQSYSSFEEVETLWNSLMFLVSYLNWSGVLGLAVGRFVCLSKSWLISWFPFYVFYPIRLFILNYGSFVSSVEYVYLDSWFWHLSSAAYCTHVPMAFIWQQDDFLVYW